MKVKKSGASNKPGYPNHKQFLAALGIGAIAAVSQADAIRTGGVPAREVKPVVTNKVEASEARLLGEIMVEPKAPAACTNTVAATNAACVTPPPVRLLGKPAVH